MTRLTERYKGVVLCPCPCPEEEARAAGLPVCTVCDHFVAMLDKLAAYEDTGLMPEDVKKLKEDAGQIDFLMNGSDARSKKLDKKEKRL